VKNTTSLLFTNPGEIDIRGATIAGLSAKETESAIGYFGTGLKYAIAQVLANGGQIVIWSGLSRHDFHAKDLEVRGQDFSQIMMDSQDAGILGDTAEPTSIPLGFTTHYGKRWKAWQIFRELYANALDEGGAVTRGGRDTISPAPGKTLIIVTGWEELQDQYFSRDEIILPPDTHYDDETDLIKVRNRASQYVYYKGVRVAARNCDLMWNFKQGLTLTEDRTLDAGSWEISHEVNKYLIQCDDEQIIRNIICAGKQTFEEGCMGWFTPPKAKSSCSEAFARVAADLYRQDPQKYREYEELAMEHEPALKEARRVALTGLQRKTLERAKMLVSKMGFEYEVEHLPIYVENLGGKTLGKYSEGEIYLSPLVFDQGTKQVVSTLYEECLHAKLGYRDCTYEMQTHLFNTIISLWEEIMEEPC